MRGRGRDLQGSQRYCYCCGQAGHFSYQCTNPIKCFRCKGEGHRQFDCPEKNTAPKGNTQPHVHNEKALAGIEVENVERPGRRRFDFTRATVRRGDVNIIEGMERYLPPKTTLLTELIEFWAALLWTLSLIWRPVTRIWKGISNLIVYLLVCMKLKAGKGHLKCHHDEESGCIGDCDACKMIGNRLRRGKSDTYCNHTWWDHKFIHWRHHKVRRVPVFHLKEQSARHTLRKQHSQEIRTAGDEMWHQMMEVCAGEFGKTAPCLIPGIVNGVGVDLLADTGAIISVISEQMVKELRLDSKIEPWELGPIKTANGNPFDIMRVVTIDVLIGGAVYHIQSSHGENVIQRINTRKRYT